MHLLKLLLLLSTRILHLDTQQVPWGAMEFTKLLRGNGNDRRDDECESDEKGGYKIEVEDWDSEYDNKLKCMN
jgi:hypothetical protein